MLVGWLVASLMIPLKEKKNVDKKMVENTIDVRTRGSIICRFYSFKISALVQLLLRHLKQYLSLNAAFPTWTSIAIIDGFLWILELAIKFGRKKKKKSEIE